MDVLQHDIEGGEGKSDEQIRTGGALQRIPLHGRVLQQRADKTPGDTDEKRQKHQLGLSPAAARARQIPARQRAAAAANVKVSRRRQRVTRRAAKTPVTSSAPSLATKRKYPMRPCSI